MANLCFIGAWFTMLYDQDYGFFNQLPVMLPALAALVVNILGLAAVIWLAMCLRRRFPNRVLLLGLHLLFLVLLLVPADFLRVQVFHILNYQIVGFFQQPMVMVCSLALLACGLGICGFVLRRRKQARG